MACRMGWVSVVFGFVLGGVIGVDVLAGCPPPVFPYLPRSFEVECYACVGLSSNHFFILRGNFWECIPCHKFPHP